MTRWGVLMEKGELIHSRNISVNTYESNDGGLIIEGTLTDERFSPFVIYYTNETRDGGIIHSLLVRMKLSVPALKIIDIEVEMPVVPLVGCEEIRGTFARLKGHEIKPGFSALVKELFGKTQGCLHLNNLILVMGSAAVQGMWTHFSKKREQRKSRLTKENSQMLFNSCWMWREDGPLAQHVRDRLEER